MPGMSSYRALPTTLLPPLKDLVALGIPDIANALTALRAIYVPLGHSGHAPTSVDTEEDLDIDILQADPMERAFAVKWLTGFIARADSWTPHGRGRDVGLLGGYQGLLDEAYELLSSFSDSTETLKKASNTNKREPEGIARHFAFPTPSGAPVQITLLDAPLLDEDHTAVGLQSWGASIIFAELICSSPFRFGLLPPRGGEISRVLELGAGTGVLSMITSKLVGEGGYVVATDFHPAVLDNLRLNIANNAPNVVVSMLDWTSPDDLDAEEQFDLVLAADVVYDRTHAALLRDCAARWLKPGGAFWLAATVRPIGRYAGVVDNLFSIFPSAKEIQTQEPHEAVLAVFSVEDIAKQRGIGRADEDGYKLLNIAWA
jgi:SAM-dependent methyltransferase